jgi:hypothetical protein
MSNITSLNEIKFGYIASGEQGDPILPTKAIFPFRDIKVVRFNGYGTAMREWLRHPDTRQPLVEFAITLYGQHNDFGYAGAVINMSASTLRIIHITFSPHRHFLEDGNYDLSWNKGMCPIFTPLIPFCFIVFCALIYILFRRCARGYIVQDVPETSTYITHCFPRL